MLLGGGLRGITLSGIAAMCIRPAWPGVTAAAQPHEAVGVVAVISGIAARAPNGCNPPPTATAAMPLVLAVLGLRHALPIAAVAAIAHGHDGGRAVQCRYVRQLPQIQYIKCMV